MRDLRREDSTFPERAPKVLTFTGRIDADPTTAWEIVADASSWTEWFPAVRESAYTSPAPHGMGSVRELALPGARFEESIVAWEPGAAWGFCVERTTAPGVRALVELWSFTGSPAGGTDVAWTFAVDRSPLGVVLLAAAPPVMSALFGRALKNLDRLDQR